MFQSSPTRGVVAALAFAVVGLTACDSPIAPEAHVADVVPQFQKGGNQAQASVLESHSLFWDFVERKNLPGRITTSFGLSTDADIITGFASQTGGGWAESWAGGIHITRHFGSYFPFIEFTTSTAANLRGVTFQHFHNHNPRYPTYGGYDVQLQIDLGDGYVDIGNSIRAARTTNGNTDTVDLGNVTVEPGTYRIRWMPRNLRNGATNTLGEFFGMPTITLEAGVIVPISSSEVAKLCQKGGHADWTRADGSAFRNAGDCTSYAVRGGTLHPAS